MAPDEVGVTQITVIERTAVALVTLGLVVILVLGIPALAIVWVFQLRHITFGHKMPSWPEQRHLAFGHGMPSWPEHWRRLEPAILGIALFGLVVSVVANLYIGFRYPNLVQKTSLLFLAILILAIVLGIAKWFSSGRPFGLRSDRTRPAPGTLLLSVIVLAFVAINLNQASDEWGEAKADSVIQNGKVDPQPLLGVELLKLPANLVCVSWVGTDRPPSSLNLSSPMVYLGQNGSQMVFYRSRQPPLAKDEREGPIRIQAAKVVTQRGQLAKRCPTTSQPAAQT